ncbi:MULTISPECIES: Ig-like domain-containing protein [Arthrobacter]|uniref:Ig-like domain-containing protein n=2 Tax=Arthrobacter TaxID=1663 RepID=A0ABU9KMG5_9MICC|nr:Ig-like domain-containing protein [Arthrobacter sp. YJM1]MDP5227356.1 Ig-like domain-containing protein [Arthrobacter sp. YJM1]
MNSSPRKGRVGKIVGLCILGAVIVLGGIGALTAPQWLGKTTFLAGPSAAPTTQAPAKPVQLSVEPVDGAKEVNPVTAPVISALYGTLKDVRLVPAGGTPVAGSYGSGNTTWKATAKLAFNTKYTLSYSAVDEHGDAVAKSSSFTTVVTKNEADTTLLVGTLGDTIGAGQPIQLTFSEPVGDQFKAGIEKAVTVTSSAGQKVKWHWYSDTLVRIRPETLWASGSTVTLDQQLFGVPFGNGQIGNFAKTSTFKVGPQRVAVVDGEALTMNVYEDGKVVHSAPVSTGADDMPSPSGDTVILEQQRVSHFTAESIGLKPGDPRYYKPTDVNYANRLTWSGVYVHQVLDGGVQAIGQRNISHGCVGLLPADADWFFTNMKPGDVVRFKNTAGPPIRPDEGYGDWNIPWAQYGTVVK